MDAEKRPGVLLTADTVGGVWTYAVELAHALAAAGVRVHLATMGAAVQAHQREQLGDVALVSLHESEFKLEWMADPWRDIQRAGAWLLSLERTLKPDVVHLNQFAFGALPFAAPTLVVAHSCVLSWWQAVHGEAAPASWDVYRERVARGLQEADLVAAPTRAMLDTLAPNYGWNGQGLVVPNGRSPALFAPAAAKEPFVFAAGRFWDEAKNLAALDAAAPELAWPVRVAGSCRRPDGGTVQPLHVVPLGELPQHAVAAEMARAAVYALPARYEPFGLSALEAALAGCALVLGDIPSLREVWGDAAVFVRPDDAAGLAGALQRLAASEAERTRLATAARRRAALYTPARMAAAYLDAYASLAPAFEQPAPEELPCA